MRYRREGGVERKRRGIEEGETEGRERREIESVFTAHQTFSVK